MFSRWRRAGGVVFYLEMRRGAVADTKAHDLCRVFIFITSQALKRLPMRLYALPIEFSALWVSSLSWEFNTGTKGSGRNEGVICMDWVAQDDPVESRG